MRTRCEKSQGPLLLACSALPCNMRFACPLTAAAPGPTRRSFDEFGRPRKKESAADREARERSALDRLNVREWFTIDCSLCYVCDCLRMVALEVRERAALDRLNVSHDFVLAGEVWL